MTLNRSVGTSPPHYAVALPVSQSDFDYLKSCAMTQKGTCGLSVTTFFHQVLNFYYLTVYIMFKPKMSLEGSVH